ncbi:MAG TPA: hypothetical protein VEA92_01205 [Candidatus Paceibacterota bacterium]|nr:hypothetical protein [Candidatus Paceibacterota bacterium]
MAPKQTDKKSPNERRVLKHEELVILGSFFSDMHVYGVEEAQDGVIDIEAFKLKGVPKNMREKFFRNIIQELNARAQRLARPET